MANIKLPGLIDVHVHLREPGANQKEDFETGTKAAIAGGYTAVLDMPNNPTPTISEEALNEKIKLATGRIYCDLGFNFGGSPASVPYFNKVKNKVFGLKVYMNQTTGPLLIEDRKDLESIFEAWPDEKVIMVHALDKTLETAIELAKKFNKKLHVCHVSLASEIELIRKGKEKGMDISCEVSAHHLFLDDTYVKKLGAFGLMKPNLASKKDVKTLWENLDYIDMIASDHAPHAREEKKSEKPPFGVPGLETTLPLLLTALNEDRLSFKKLIDLTSTKPCQRFGIPKQPNTFVQIDPAKEWKIGDDELFTKAGWTPFNNMKVVGKIDKVVIRGKEIFASGEFKTNPLGQIIYPIN